MWPKGPHAGDKPPKRQGGVQLQWKDYCALLQQNHFELEYFAYQSQKDINEFGEVMKWRGNAKHEEKL